MSGAVMAFLHHLAAFTLVGALGYEFIAFRRDLSVAEARRLQRVYIAYGISAALLLIIGLLRVFYFGKGASFYAQNWFFWTKMAGFALTALLSVYPTVRIISWIKPLGRNEPPQITDREVSTIRFILRLELVAVAIILFSAAMMARGLGMIS